MKLTNPAGDEGAEFDMTPMIDIVFLLIAFFMIVAAVLTLDRITVETPVAIHAKIPDEFGKRTTISIALDGLYYSGTQVRTLEEVKAMVAEEFRLRGIETKIYVRADANTEHQYVSDLMSACAEAGISKIIFATFQSEK